MVDSASLMAAYRARSDALRERMDADVALVSYPLPKPLAQQLRDALGASVRASVSSLSLPSAVRQLVATLQVLPAGTPLLIPPGLTEIH